MTSHFICVFLWLGNGSPQLSAPQGPVVEGPAHGSSGKDEPVPGAQGSEWGREGSEAAPVRPNWLTGPVILLSLCSLAEASLQLPFANCFRIWFGRETR